PNWEWYILLYFFFAGLSGGAFVIGTMLRLWGSAADWVASRIAFLISFPLLLVCPILLTIDLGKPLDFWHMLVNTGSSGGLSFKAYSPMSLGAWGLLLFGIFSFVMFVVALGEGGYVRARAFERVGRLPSHVLGLILIILFLVTLGGVVSTVLGGGWILLWLVVLIGTVVPLVIHWRPAWVQQVSPILTAVLVLVGVLALRAVIIFSAQA